MYLRISVEDTVKIRCYQLDPELFPQYLEDELHAKYANKVIPNQGLVVLVLDFEHVGAPFVFPGQGHVHVTCKVGLLVFRPLEEQIVQAKVRYSDPSGILGKILIFMN
jgi:DNA-directed RNA polymerase III subunit RPC8